MKSTELIFKEVNPYSLSDHHKLPQEETGSETDQASEALKK